MTKPKITDGEWEANVSEMEAGSPAIMIRTNPDGRLVADLHGAGPINARFMAASKKMAEALEGLLDQIENGVPFGNKTDAERQSVLNAKSALIAAGYKF